MNTTSILSLLSVTSSACGADGPPGECPADRVVNIGHRGTGTNGPANPMPENTLPAFLRGQAEGAQLIELDVMHSFDGALMVIHDPTVDRTTDGVGCVGALTVAELQQLDAANGTELEGTGVFIPTLDQVLAAVDVGVNIEIKVDDGACPPADRMRLAADVLDAIRNDAAGREFIVSSFDAAVLGAARQLDPNLKLGLLTLVPSDVGIALDHGLDALNVLSITLRANDVQALHEEGLEVAVWTENDAVDIDSRFTQGVDMIITDEPDLVEVARAEWCAREGYSN